MKQKIRLIFKWIFKLVIALAVFLSVVSIPFLIAFEKWDVVRYILYCVSFLVYIQIHKKIIKNKKFEWYRWLVNSLFYRLSVSSLKYSFSKLSYSDKIRYHADYILRKKTLTKWYDKYWFGRGLDNVLTNEMIKAHKNNGRGFN